MNFLEILFIISLVSILITWIWFIVLGFRANKAWGFSIVFLSPIAPFMFASRFARKARQAVYYYMITLLIFISCVVYIHFSTVNFYKSLLEKITESPAEVIIEKTPPIININEPLTQENQKVNLEIKEPIQAPVKIKPQPKKHSYKQVSIGSIHIYINKRIIITTSRTKHKGKLLSITPSSLSIRKRSAGGSVTMPIKKNKIIKLEVYQ